MKDNNKTKGQLIQELIKTRGKIANLEVNKSFEKINSMKKEEVINKKISEVFKFKDIPDLEKYAQVALQGKKKVFETHIPRYGKYFKVASYSPRKGYFVTIFEDITRQKKPKKRSRSLTKSSVYC